MKESEFENRLKQSKLNISINRLDVSDPEQVGAKVVLDQLSQEAWRNASNMELAGWAWKETLETLRDPKFSSSEISELFRKKIIEACQKRASFGGDSVPKRLSELAQPYEKAMATIAMVSEMIEECITNIKNAEEVAQIVGNVDRILKFLDAQKGTSPFIISSDDKKKLRESIENIINAHLSTLNGVAPARALEEFRIQALNIVSQLQVLLSKFTDLKRF